MSADLSGTLSMSRGSHQAHLGESDKLLEKGVLERDVECSRGRRFAALVEPVAAAGCRLRFVADREPRLSAVPELEVVGCATNTHTRWHPLGAADDAELGGAVGGSSGEAGDSRAGGGVDDRVASAFEHERD